MLPYLYTAFWRYANEGIPILKSLVLYDQKDAHTHYRNDEFIFGEKILVCPINEPNAKGRRMYVPRGKWYNFWTDEVVEGGQELWVDADFDSMPIFVKEGAIIPKYPVQQYVGEKTIDEVSLDVYYKLGKETSQVFEDAHDGYDYIKGRYSVRNFNLLGVETELYIQQHKSGKYIAPFETFKINLHGLPFKISKITIDKEDFIFDDVKVNDSNSFVVNKDFTEIQMM